MPIILNIAAENLIAHIVFVTRRKIRGKNRGARLIREKIDERAARGFNVRRSRPRAVVSGRLRHETCCESAVTIDSIDCDDVILLGQESETELQTVIPARNECVIVYLENLVPEILVCRPPKLPRRRYSRAR